MWDHFLFTFYQNPYKLKQWHLFRFIKNYFISINQYNKLYLKRNFENILPFGASSLSLKFNFHMKHLWVAFIMIVKFISSHFLFCYLKCHPVSTTISIYLHTPSSLSPVPDNCWEVYFTGLITHTALGCQSWTNHMWLDKMRFI